MVQKNLWTTLIELLGLVLATNYARSSIMHICQDAQSGNAIRFFQLLLNHIIPVLVVILFVKYGERRSVTSLGFTTKGRIKSYLQGATLGVLLIAFIAMLSFQFGEIGFSGVNKSFSWIPYAATLFLSAINIREEIIFRGWLLTTPYSIAKPLNAIIGGSVIFGIIHCWNENVTLLSIINLILFSILLSEIFLIHKNIWIVAALHTTWNFTQGKILGLPVSGSPANNFLLDFNITQNTNTDGFGLEGSIFTLIILAIAIAVATKKILYLRRQDLYSLTMEESCKR